MQRIVGLPDRFADKFEAFDTVDVDGFGGAGCEGSGGGIQVVAAVHLFQRVLQRRSVEGVEFMLNSVDADATRPNTEA